MCCKSLVSLFAERVVEYEIQGVDYSYTTWNFFSDAIESWYSIIRFGFDRMPSPASCLYRTKIAVLSGILKHNISRNYRADPNDNPENQPIVLDFFRNAIDIQEGSEERENYNITITERSTSEPDSILPTDALDEIVQKYWDDHNLDLIDMAVPGGLAECVQNIQETLHAVNSVFEPMKVKTSFEKIIYRLLREKKAQDLIDRDVRLENARERRLSQSSRGSQQMEE